MWENPPVDPPLEPDISTPIDDLTVLKGLQLLYLYYLREHDGEKKDRIHQEMKLIRQLPQYRNKYTNNMDSNGIFKDYYVEYSTKKTTFIIVGNGNRIDIGNDHGFNVAKKIKQDWIEAGYQESEIVT